MGSEDLPARDEFFHMADHRLRCPVEELSQWVKDAAVNAAMLMTHSVPMDAQSLSAVEGCGLDYVGLLGPPTAERKYRRSWSQ